MRRFLAVRTACWLFVLVCSARVSSAQQWNDARTLELVARAIARRDQQLADTGLSDYQARAHGYVTFLAQLGEGFLSPPKVIKADELESEVYWHAPNSSKQIIIGRRDTLLLPTDIAYHRDHLGIVQNNFPNIIRVGDGDEVRDVPHPLSAQRQALYDYALTDSLSIGSGTQKIRVYVVKIRPKDDTLARVVGAAYLDASEGQVVRLDLSFTRAAFRDPALEELSILLENRLISGRFWLPSTQKIEILRTGSWLDYPIRAVIRGRWEIGDYRFNLSPNPAIFAGAEIVQAPPSVTEKHVWHGAIMDSLPPDVRAVTDADVERVQAEARAVVRAQALARAQKVSISARSFSDVAHVNRAEGLSIGEGLSKQLGGGWSGVVRARYGIDDRQVHGSAGLAWMQPSGFGIRLFAMHDFRDAGDVQERSMLVNTIAAQEFGSDYTDPYLARSVGAGVDFAALDMRWHVNGSYEWQSPVAVHAEPVTGRYEPVIAAQDYHVARVALNAVRPPSLWLWGTELAGTAELRATAPLYEAVLPGFQRLRTVRATMTASIERPFGAHRLVTSTTISGLLAGPNDFYVPQQELIYFGGPVSGPGYDYHQFATNGGASAHVEWRTPAPFVPFSLGRFGRVPAQGTFAPYVHALFVNGFAFRQSGVFPSIGAGYILPFDLVRIDVARGLRGTYDLRGRRTARWTFSVDVGRDLWSIL